MKADVIFVHHVLKYLTFFINHVNNQNYSGVCALLLTLHTFSHTQTGRHFVSAQKAVDNNQYPCSPFQQLCLTEEVQH